MIKSMTGFGKGEYIDSKRSVSCEIRSVNHRYCDIQVKMPRRYSFAEDRIKSAVKEVMKRGKIELYIVIDNLTEEDITVKVNTPVAEQYVKSLKELKDAFDLDGEVSLEMIAGMPDVVKAVPDVADEEGVAAAIVAAVKSALTAIDAMRATEGEKLKEDLVMRGGLIHKFVDSIREKAPEVGKQYAARLNDRIQELIGDSVEVPEERILLEAAIFADKANITEELVRMDSHLKQLKTILEGDSPCGKKLDFLVQEMNRETNTIGSKANDIGITDVMLNIKSEVEKIREQVQNIE